MRGEAALAVDHVGKRFDGLVVIDDVSFALAPGSRTALIGPNGAGKTTLFNLISGAYAPDDGAISLAGERIDALAPRKRVAAGLSRSFQNIRLMPHLSVVENVMLGQHVLAGGIANMLTPLSWARGGRWRTMAIDRLRDAGIDVDPDADVSALPYGLRKKIELVRALMSDPKVLMLDEPVAGLNPQETADLSQFLHRMAGETLTLFIVEHDMSFVQTVCDRALVLNFGKLIYAGTTAGAQDDEQVREAYLGKRRAQEKPHAHVA